MRFSFSAFDSPCRRRLEQPKQIEKLVLYKLKCTQAHNNISISRFTQSLICSLLLHVLLPHTAARLLPKAESTGRGRTDSQWEGGRGAVTQAEGPPAPSSSSCPPGTRHSGTSSLSPSAPFFLALPSPLWCHPWDTARQLTVEPVFGALDLPHSLISSWPLPLCRGSALSHSHSGCSLSGSHPHPRFQQLSRKL